MIKYKFLNTGITDYAGLKWIEKYFNQQKKIGLEN